MKLLSPAMEIRPITEPHMRGYYTILPDGSRLECVRCDAGAWSLFRCYPATADTPESWTEPLRNNTYAVCMAQLRVIAAGTNRGASRRRFRIVR